MVTLDCELGSCLRGAESGWRRMWGWSPWTPSTGPEISAGRLGEVMADVYSEPSAAATRAKVTWNARATASTGPRPNTAIDRKSTRLNSSHLGISYAVF